MDADGLAIDVAAVIALENDRLFACEVENLAVCSVHAELACKLQAEMLVLGMPVQMWHRRLEDVGRGRVASRDPPAIAALVEMERRLRLRTSETELTGIADSPGSCTVPAQVAQVSAQALAKLVREQVLHDHVSSLIEQQLAYAI